MISPHIVRKTTDPIAAPPEAGIHWINTVTNVEFFSIGTSSVADWIPRNASMNTFTNLTDTPDTYVGQAGKVPVVNPGETGLIFAVPLTSDEKVKVSSNDTTDKYLEDAIVVSHGTNASNVLQKTTLNDGGDEDVQIQFDISKVDLSQANNTTSDFASKAFANAKVADAINDGTTTVAPSQNAVFDALALKQNSLGFTPEDVVNKATDLLTPDNIKYPTTLAVQSAINSALSSSAIYMLSGVNSDISGYEEAVPLTSFTAGALATVSQTVTTAETLLEEFASPIGLTNISAIPVGVFTIHYETQKTNGPRYYYSYAKIFKRSAGGVETLLLTSDNSSQVDLNSVYQVAVTALVPSIITILPTDRIVIKIYARTTSGSDTITLRWDGTTDARVQSPGSSLAYIPEDSANKTTNFTGNTGSNIKFPTVKAIYDAIVGYLASYQPLLGFTPANETLSNLPSTSIGVDLLPESDGIQSIGASGLNWNQIQAKTIGYDGATAINLDSKKMFDTATGESIDFESRKLKDSASLDSVDYELREARDAIGNRSLSWQNRTAHDDSDILSMEYSERRLFSTDGVTPTLDWSNNLGPTTITQPINDNSTKIATTEYVDRIPKFDRRNFVTFFDDFIGAQASSSLGFNAVNSGVGASNTSSVGGALGALGVYQFSTGTTAAGRSTLFAGASSVLPGQGVINYSWRVRISNLSDATNTTTVYVGLGDNNGAGDMVDGVYFTYTHAVNGGNWTLSTSTSNVRTTADSGVAPTALTWTTLGVRINAAGNSAEYFINEVSVGTITTNIPTAAGRETGPIAKIQKSLGISNHLLQVDYFYMDYTPTTPR